MKAQPTRERIILAALDLLSRGGIRALTSSELVRRSGVSKGGLYHHFTSMDAVLQAAAKACLQQFESLLVPQEGVSTRACIEQVRRQHPALLRVLLCLQAEASFDEALKQQLDDFWGAVVRNGQPDASPQAHACQMLCLLTQVPAVDCSPAAFWSAACKSA